MITYYEPPVNPQIATLALPHGGEIGVNAPAMRNNVNSTLVECITTYEANKQRVIIGVKKKGIGC